MILKGYFFSTLYALLCLVFAFALYKMGVNKKITRKIVHILVGLEWFILYHYMGAGWHFLSVCLAFLIILAVAYRKKLLPMIASDGDNSPGTVYYAAAMSVMAFVSILIPDMMLPFGIGVLCTSLGDGFAGLVGQSISAGWNKRIYKNKTLAGSLINLALCLVSAMIFSSAFDLGLTWLNCLSISVLVLQLELFTGKGLDNVSITIGASLLSYLLMYFPTVEFYILPILVTPAFIVLSYEKKALNVYGVCAALLLDVIVSVALGNFGFFTLAVFFVGGIITDKIKKKEKKAEQNIKGSALKSHDCRNHRQVLANGGVAAISALLFLFTGYKAFVIAFIASLSEALADTSASGIGSLSGQAYDPFRRQKCRVGLSGGMSLLGTVASFIGASVIPLLVAPFGFLTFFDVVLIIISAFTGAIFDSALGSLLQAKYRCRHCDVVVEEPIHCGEKTDRISGFSFVTNDLVNFFGTGFSALVSCILFSILTFL